MILGFLILAAFFLLSVKRPAWALGLILGLLPTYLIRFKLLNNIPTTALELLVGIFLFVVILTHFQEIWPTIKRLGKLNWIIGAFVLAAVISTLYSPELARALGQLKAFFIEPILVFYASVIVLKKPQDYKIVLRILFVFAALISAFGLLQYWTHLFLPLRFWGYGVEVKRITSVFEYPNALALYLAPLSVFFFALWTKGFELFKKHWMILGFIFIFLAIVLTYSRGAWLGVAAGIFILLLQKSGVSLKRWGAMVVIGLLILSPIIVTRFKSTFHDGASSERLQLFAAAESKLLQEPFLGNGLYGFRETLETSDYKGEILNYPHNIILNFWLETGLLGLICFALLIFFALKQYKSNPTTLKFAAGLFLLTMITHGMVDAPYFKNDLSIMFWFILAIFYMEE